MQQWDRDTSGRLNRISTQLDLASEVSVQTDTMDPIPEEQQSQPGTPMNPNAYRTMRDHIHPPRVSAPSCIIPPADDVAVRPYLVPLLPTYHGMENENPYTHLRDFEEVCTTFKEGMMDMDLLKLKAFPLTLKDKAKIWLNSLRPRTIRNWAELQAEFLKKFFSAHKTNNLKRQIYTFAAHEGEKFYQCWERFLETISACPHHGFDTWMLVNHFYGGMSPAMRQLLETMCGGDFLSKHPDEAMEFLSYVAETSKGWDEPNPREIERFRPPVNQRGGMYALNDEMEMKDLCTIKRGLGIEKKAFLTEHVSALIQSKYPVKYKDPGSPTIPVNIGGNCINKALLDLGASVNLMPFSVYMQLGLGELKPTSITLSLVDRSVKIPKGIVEDVLVKINNFYYPVDFVVLDTAPSSNEPNHVPIILGRPFLATANAIINCRNGIMQLTFGDMILELNIFHLNDNPKLLETENPITDEVVSVDQCVGKKGAKEKQGVISLGDEGELVLPTTPIASQLLESTTIPEEQFNLWPPNIMEPGQATAWVEEIILLDPP